ncbi:MAG TPA: endonuclease, partial [Verrucomicrobiae bacterium]|nr:endonuclease [Verrucomicrobiae bacterium]
MKNFFLRLVCLGALLFGLGMVPATAEPIVVMAYNLRYASDQGPNAWPDRRPLMSDCLRELMPDLIGTQEGVYSQLKNLAADLPEYAWIGLGRDG